MTEQWIVVDPDTVNKIAFRIFEQGMCVERETKIDEPILEATRGAIRLVIEGLQAHGYRVEMKEIE